MQQVQSKGIYHGLPVYSDDVKDLVALVTGANGISGYHMVKVLAAAPQRWKKIYCLSRRPPPDYFFTDLGDGASRVEHVSVDFLSDPQNIGKKLKEKIERVDHVFFFSYVQPTQKGGVTGMWSDADALAEINTSLISNFTEGLKIADLAPKRFMLQTGAKHYGFHMGPATNPSFESDPRVLLENNFYYPQEDHLFKYCKEIGAKWNVVRPSYIIGAVRDNLLNQMVGISVYAAVQAYLGKPLLFPGDFVAWDKEICQSTAMLNGYFEEWCVLTENVANEAFNIQDGLNFTWGKFWPYLANWYGVAWEPPELDESKYRTVETRHEKTPRGYGAGITRSSFSLQEWSEASDVVQAWNELSEKHGLLLDPFKDRAQIFGLSDSAIIGGWPLSLSMRKARKFGFHGTVDSFEAAFETIQGLVKMHVAAPMAATKFEEVV